MFTRIHTAHVYFSQIVKLSALLCIFRSNCKSNSGLTVHFYKSNFLRMVLVRLHQPLHSTVEMKRGSFHQNERLFVVEKANFLYNVVIQGGKWYSFWRLQLFNEKIHDWGIRKGFNSLPDDNFLSFRIENIFETIKWLLIK